MFVEPSTTAQTIRGLPVIICISRMLLVTPGIVFMSHRRVSETIGLAVETGDANVPAAARHTASTEKLNLFPSNRRITFEFV